MKTGFFFALWFLNYEKQTYTMMPKPTVTTRRSRVSLLKEVGTVWECVNLKTLSLSYVRLTQCHVKASVVKWTVQTDKQLLCSSSGHRTLSKHDVLMIVRRREQGLCMRPALPDRTTGLLRWNKSKRKLNSIGFRVNEVEGDTDSSQDFGSHS